MTTFAMSTLWIAAATALWLGVLTSISPCPLATNVAAVSYVARSVSRPRSILLAGLLYSMGRAIAYVAIAALVVKSLLSIPQLSLLLQKYVNQLLGPVLILAGMFLVGLLRLPGVGVFAGARITESLAQDFGGSFLLGALFALSFCPMSAALFFGSLIPLATSSRSSILLPALYGLGTALPVIAFAVLTASGTRSISRLFDRLISLEAWARRLTGALFLSIGIYFSWIYLIEGG
ncbi:MAG: aromatic aminobenezylarsenical efflux permease ArsG family transporter [Acidobacteriaceae bacterium]